MRSFGFLASLVALLVLCACTTPDTAIENRESEERTYQTDEGVNPAKEDNTDIQTMEEKYKDSDADVVSDSLSE
jgi:outer membrane biogenesis lipoprotein LolB